jgi:anti-sigma B factor antagonist
MTIKIEIDTTQHEHVTIVGVSGSLDSITSESLMLVLNDHVKNGNIYLVVDLAKVHYTSSAGLRSLLMALKGARQKGGDMRLGAVQKNVFEVLSLSGFTSIIKIFDDVKSAVSSYAK